MREIHIAIAGATAINMFTFCLKNLHREITKKPRSAITGLAVILTKQGPMSFLSGSRATYKKHLLDE